MPLTSVFGIGICFDSTEREKEEEEERNYGNSRKDLMERENSNSNSQTLFYKDCSLGSFKNLSNN